MTKIFQSSVIKKNIIKNTLKTKTNKKQTKFQSKWKKINYTKKKTMTKIPQVI